MQLAGVVGRDAPAVEHAQGGRVEQPAGDRRARRRTPPGPSPGWRCGRCRSPRSARRRSRASPPPPPPPGRGRPAPGRRASASVSPASRCASDSPHADDHLQPGVERRAHAGGHLGVGLPGGPALGVADERPVGARRHDHPRRDLAGVGARRRLVHGLGVAPRPALPDAARAAASSAVNGAQTATSAASSPSPSSARRRATCSRASTPVLFIFQLPATSGRRPLTRRRSSAGRRRPAGCGPPASRARRRRRWRRG